MAKNLSNLRAPRKANTGRKRVGRGMGSGMGKTSTRGHKGQGSRTGSSLMRGFEGGQMPLHRRLPKRGFTNIFRTEYTVINLDRIVAQTEGKKVSEIALEDYKKLGLASKKNALIKILGSGELTTAITIHAHKFSRSAVEKIERQAARRCYWAPRRQRPRVGGHEPVLFRNADSCQPGHQYPAPAGSTNGPAGNRLRGMTPGSSSGIDSGDRVQAIEFRDRPRGSSTGDLERGTPGGGAWRVSTAHRGLPQATEDRDALR
jgi:large subunit ribosomal protein L15